MHEICVSLGDESKRKAMVALSHHFRVSSGSPVLSTFKRCALYLKQLFAFKLREFSLGSACELGKSDVSDTERRQQNPSVHADQPM